MRSINILSILLALMAACSAPIEKTAPTPAAKVTGAAPESALATVVLSEQAQKRLGIEVAAAERRRLTATVTAPGEVIPPPGKSLIVSAPIAATISSDVLRLPGTLVTQGDVIIRLIPLPSATELASAQIRLEAAQKRRDRAQVLLRDGAGSQRGLEEADAELATAQANVGAGTGGDSSTAILRVKAPFSGVIRDLLVGPGQAVASGAPLFQLDAQRSLWVRTSLYVGDAQRVDRSASANVFSLSAKPTDTGLEAISVTGPPSANADAAGEDLFYQLPQLVDGGAPELRPRQRVSVTVPLKDDEEALAVLWSSILFDAYGGTWVYCEIETRKYARRRVQIRRVVDRWAVLERGLLEGERVVTVGAAEIFGTEFGAGK